MNMTELNGNEKYRYGVSLPRLPIPYVSWGKGGGLHRHKASAFSAPLRETKKTIGLTIKSKHSPIIGISVNVPTAARICRGFGIMSNMEIGVKSVVAEIALRALEDDFARIQS